MKGAIRFDLMPRKCFSLSRHGFPVNLNREAPFISSSWLLQSTQPVSDNVFFGRVLQRRCDIWLVVVLASHVDLDNQKSSVAFRSCTSHLNLDFVFTTTTEIYQSMQVQRGEAKKKIHTTEQKQKNSKKDTTQQTHKHKQRTKKNVGH